MKKISLSATAGQVWQEVECRKVGIFLAMCCGDGVESYYMEDVFVLNENAFGNNEQNVPVESST